MKKSIALLLTLVMLAAMLFGCGTGAKPEDVLDDEAEGAIIAQPDEETQDAPQENAPLDLPGMGGTELQLSSSATGEMKYVMIYNPNIYSENYDAVNTTLGTGSMGAQVDVDMAKADGLEVQNPYQSISQGELNKDLPVDMGNLGESRGETMLTPYQKGDTRNFYRFDTNMDLNRTQDTFTCRYAGTYCNIWTNDSSVKDSNIETYGKAFDEDIYLQTVETYGTARFADNGGKVNLLFYTMRDGLLGCFFNRDIFSTDELVGYDVDYYGFNADHAIVHINAIYTAYPELKDMVCSTMAHEFQHLICATDMFYTFEGIQMGTWLNEAMSGYIEEQLYPGTKTLSGHYDSLVTSDSIRYGQSMYNFTTTDTDIGVYGSVYLFSEYLANLAGPQVFSNLHNYWRTSYSTTLSDAEALVNAVGDTAYWQIENAFAYPDNWNFASAEAEWMSKLTLNYYLSQIKAAGSGIRNFEMIDGSALLYDQILPAELEGGGRIIIAVKENTYYIPEDADQGLVYVGLDENFNVVTDFVFV